MKDRKLHLELSATIEFFEYYKNKFFSIEDKQIKVEVTRETDNLIVVLPCATSELKQGIVQRLLDNDFIRQEVTHTKW